MHGLVHCERGAAGNSGAGDTSIASIYVWLLEAMHDIEKFERGRLATLEQMGVSIDFIKVWSPRPRMNLCVVRGG